MKTEVLRASVTDWYLRGDTKSRVPTAVTVRERGVTVRSKSQGVYHGLRYFMRRIQMSSYAQTRYAVLDRRRP